MSFNPERIGKRVRHIDDRFGDEPKTIFTFSYYDSETPSGYVPIGDAMKVARFFSRELKKCEPPVEMKPSDIPLGETHGFNHSTVISFVVEVSGTVQPPESWRPQDVHA